MRASVCPRWCHAVDRRARNVACHRPVGSSFATPAGVPGTGWSLPCGARSLGRSVHARAASADRTWTARGRRPGRAGRGAEPRAHRARALRLSPSAGSTLVATAVPGASPTSRVGLRLPVWSPRARPRHAGPGSRLHLVPTQRRRPPPAPRPVTYSRDGERAVRAARTAYQPTTNAMSTMPAYSTISPTFSLSV